MNNFYTRQETRKAEREAARALVVDHVEGVTLKNGSFQTVAVLDDGSRVIIRASATRPYLNAYRHHGGGVSSAKTPLGRHFRLAKSPSRDHDDLVEVFKIQYK